MGSKPRIRRTARAAKRAILDVAEAQLARGGPDSLRLQQVATEVGMSHSAVLHHFGTREGLVAALVARSGERMKQEILAVLEGPVDETSAAVLLDRLFRNLRDESRTRPLAWLLLTQEEAVGPVGLGDHLRTIAGVIHARRAQRGGASAEVPFEDTAFTVALVALSMLGDAVAGPAMWRSGGLLGREGADVRFTAWLARLLHAHLDGRNR